MYYQPGEYDGVVFEYLYDYAGRLQAVNHFSSEIPDDPNGVFNNVATYEYNENSQIESELFANGETKNEFHYNNRKWIDTLDCNQGFFQYVNSYFKNGNVKTQKFSGDYNDRFTNKSVLNFTNTYDKSNRLTQSAMSHSYKTTNTYDKDGNILTMKRYDALGYVTDDFSYSYYTGTNKLKKVTGSSDQYYYDGNGNVRTDSVNKNINMIYDYRNLLLQVRHSEFGTDTNVYVTYYDYDESGNRIRKKVYEYVGSSSYITVETPEVNEVGDSPSTWELIKDEIYSRGVDGKELAIYENSNLRFWNIWSNDNIGRINEDDSKYFYIKDHLGSVRIVLDEAKEIISGEDYDSWGYPIVDRTYRVQDSKYKFTGKERDEENNYNYFGARYYDGRIGRWGQVEPLLDKYPQLNPYNYSLDNPFKLIDINGLDVIVVLSGEGYHKAGQQISPSDYSENSNIGAEKLLYRLQTYADKSGKWDLDIRGYYSSLGLFGSKNEVTEAANFIINNLESQEEKVIIYGYSQGGANAVELANYLNEKGIKVSVLFTVDAYEGLSETSGFTIPENTKENFNYFQIEPDPLIGARGTINTARSPGTRIRNKIIKNSSHQSIDEKTINDVLRIVFNKIE